MINSSSNNNEDDDDDDEDHSNHRRHEGNKIRDVKSILCLHLDIRRQNPDISGYHCYGCVDFCVKALVSTEPATVGRCCFTSVMTSLLQLAHQMDDDGESFSTAQVCHESFSNAQVCHESFSTAQVCHESFSTVQVCHESFSTVQVCHESFSTVQVCLFR